MSHVETTTILGNLAAEMTWLADRVLELEDMMDAMLDTATPLSDPRMQNIDLVHQGLQDLSRAISLLDVPSNQDLRFDNTTLLDVVTLERTRACFVGARIGDDSPAPSDITLF